MTAAVCLLVLAAAAPTATAQVARVDVEHIVRELGYGAGIHAFKNYVLRGGSEYEQVARTAFAGVIERLAAIERAGVPDGDDGSALSDLRRVLVAHEAAIARISELREKGWRIRDIDSNVTLDVAPALSALERLRSGHAWSELAEIEYQLGFGRGIHRFKDFVLRGDDEDRDAARAAFQAAEAVIASALRRPGLSEREARRLQVVARTAAAYRTRLDLVARLLAAGRSVREVDLAVKINDGPATRALDGLRRASSD